MILDTSPLVSILKETGSEQVEVHKIIFETFRGDLTTTFPCLTEAMHLVGTWHYQSRIWNWITDKSILVLDLDENDLHACRF